MNVFQDSPDPSREQVVKLSVSCVCFSFPYNQLAMYIFFVPVILALFIDYYSIN